MCLVGRCCGPQAFHETCGSGRSRSKAKPIVKSPSSWHGHFLFVARESTPYVDSRMNPLKKNHSGRNGRASHFRVDGGSLVLGYLGFLESIFLGLESILNFPKHVWIIWI